MSKKEPNPIRPTDDVARTLAVRLIGQARYGALAVNDPDTGYPMVSRIAFAADGSGAPVFLASDLSVHSKLLARDSRASILIGDVAKGDPLASPRITLVGDVAKRTRAAAETEGLRQLWLKRHPKASLYIDFADFHFYRLAVARAHLNGGFGKAYVLEASDLSPPVDRA